MLLLSHMSFASKHIVEIHETCHDPHPSEADFMRFMLSFVELLLLLLQYSVLPPELLLL